MTTEEFYAQAHALGRCELLDGRVVTLPLSNWGHGRTMARITSQLEGHVALLRLGEVLSGDTGIILARNPDRVRAPDVCFFAAERLTPDVPDTGFLEIVPDLVIEVVSPNDTFTEVQQKTAEWLRAGVRLVWLLNPQTRTVLASTSLDPDRVYHEDDTLTGEPVLPGFSVLVSELFQ